MAIYYIDLSEGDNNNNGLSEHKPLKDETGLDLKPGDTVLFKRGGFKRGKLLNVSGSENNPIRYASYGEGEKPVFCGSVDLSDKDFWKEEEPNIWVCNKLENDEAGNFVFNNSESYGTLRWTKSELKEQGDFFDECFGCSEKKCAIPPDHKLYLYSKGNPADVYKNIECVTYGERNLADNGHDMIFEDLKFINSGVHAIAGEAESKNIEVKNCEFKNIGGCVWSYDLKIRFGNGVEFWDVAENIKITGCRFENIYDSATTHQGGSKCKPAENFIINNNIFIKCGMAAYEQRDKLPLYAEFNNNICIDAGNGFSKQGEVMPRRSEIWPQPMGHHVFLWRIEDAAVEEKLVMKNNIFYNAPYGAAIYSIISEAAEKQIDLDGNIYYTENEDLLNRFFGKNYKNFDEYCDIEKNAKYEKVDIKKLIEKTIK